MAKMRLKYKSITELESSIKLEDMSRYKTKMIVKAMQELASKGKQLLFSDQKEEAYSHFYRYMSLFTIVIKSNDYNRNQSTYKSALADAEYILQKTEELKTELINLYKLEEMNTDSIKSSPSKSLSSKPPDELSGESATNDKNKLPTYISNNYHWIEIESLIESLKTNKSNPNKFSYILYDTRPETDYAASHLYPHEINNVNIPINSLPVGTSAARLEDVLTGDAQEKWKDRTNYDYLILMGQSDTPTNLTPSVRSLHDIVTKWDPNTNYNHPPVLLDSGYQDFRFMYPTYCNAMYNTPTQRVQDNILDSIVYPCLDFGKGYEETRYPRVAPSIDRSKKPICIGDEMKRDEHLETLVNNIIGEHIVDQSGDKSLENANFNETTEDNNISGKFPTKMDVDKPKKTFTEKETGKQEYVIPSAQPNEPKEEPHSIIGPKNYLNPRVVLNRIDVSQYQFPAVTIQPKAPLNPRVVLNRIDVSRYETPVKVPKKNILIPRVVLTRVDAPYFKSFTIVDCQPTVDRSKKPQRNQLIYSFERYDGVFKANPYDDSTICGLQNRSNYCYINSIMQNLFHLEKFRNYFLNGHYVSYLNRKSLTGGQITDELASMIHHYFSGKFSSLSTVVLKDVLGTYSARFANNTQEDCHEFFMVLLHYLHEELAFQISIPDNATEPDRRFIEYMNNGDSIINKLFFGQSETRVRCNACLFESSTYTPFGCLTVETVATTLRECIMETYREEHVDDFRCDRCHKKGYVTKMTNLYRTPVYLTIHLKRFRNLGQRAYNKRVDRIIFENHLTLSTETGNYNYLLNGICTHFGTLNHGHYKAYVCTGSDEDWYMFDDARVAEVKNTSVIDESISKDAYMLFYKRVSIT